MLLQGTVSGDGPFYDIDYCFISHPELFLRGTGEGK